jgi:hypothetical protein
MIYLKMFVSPRFNNPRKLASILEISLTCDCAFYVIPTGQERTRRRVPQAISTINPPTGAGLDSIPTFLRWFLLYILIYLSISLFAMVNIVNPSIRQACDRCRRQKQRCNFTSENGVCVRCTQAQAQCLMPPPLRFNQQNTSVKYPFTSARP